MFDRDSTYVWNQGCKFDLIQWKSIIIQSKICYKEKVAKLKKNKKKKVTLGLAVLVNERTEMDLACFLLDR